VYLNTFADFMVQVSEAIVLQTSDMNAGDLVNLHQWHQNRNYFLIIALAVCIPLSLPRQVTVLKYTSTVAILCIVYTAGLVLAFSVAPVEKVCETFLEKNNGTACFTNKCCLSEAPGSKCCIGDVEMFSSSASNVLSAFPSMMNSFACAPQLFAAYNALVNPTLRRLGTGTSVALSASLALYLIIAVCGYLTYGSEASSDLLSVYPLTTEVTIARLGIAIVVLTSYPLFIHVSRDSFIWIIATLAGNPSLENYKSKAGRLFFFVSVAIMLVVTFAIAGLALDLSFLLNLIGTVAVSNLSFTLPGLFYLSLFSNTEGLKTYGSAVFLVAFGLVIMLANMVLWVIGAM
jgi:amino acid permease